MTQRFCEICGKEVLHDLTKSACKVGSCRTQYYVVQDKIKLVQESVKSGKYDNISTLSIKILKRYGYKVSLIEEIEPGREITVARVRGHET